LLLFPWFCVCFVFLQFVRHPLSLYHPLAPVIMWVVVVVAVVGDMVVASYPENH
jgi:hypothetical protein